MVKLDDDLNEPTDVTGLGRWGLRLGYQAGLSIIGLVGGYLLAILMFWLGPLALVPAVAFTVLAVGANGPSWLRPMAIGGAVGAATPWLVMLGNSFA